ncbi:unnamed protein product, partial [Closterium sp. NIES-64]
AMSNCELLGSLPSELGMLPNLGYLDLSFNSLTGSLPLYLAKLTGLDTLDLSHNQLSGSIPKDLLPTNLRRLDLSCNELSGTIPNTIGGLLQLEHLDLSSNRFSGSIPTEMTDLIQLTLLNLRSNQLTGSVLQPIPHGMRQYQLDNNYFSSAFPSQPPCPAGTIITTRSNCAVAKDGSPAPTFSCPEGLDAQRRAEVCRAFCGLSSESLPCGGHGVCFFDGPNRVPTCACDSGYTNGGVPGSCVPDDGSLPFINTTSDSSPPTSLSLSGSASLLPTAAILLSPAQPTNWGAAFLPQPIRLFSFALLSSSSCGRALPFSTSFAFTIALSDSSPSPPSANAFAALAFIVSATGAVAGGTSSSSSGWYLPESEHSIAVVFDAVPASASNPKGIVSIQVKSSTSSSSSTGFTSIATATAPSPLNDGSPKYAWIDYHPSSSSAAAAAAAAAAATGSLRVFLSSRPSPRPSKPVLSARISLCALLQPTESASAFFLGFAAASDNPPLELTLLQWSIAAGLQSVPIDSAFPLGLTLSDDSLSPPHVNPFFRYASAGVLPLHPNGDTSSSSSSSSGGGGGASSSGSGTSDAQDTEPEQTWLVSPSSSWFRPDLLWPVRQQQACGDCWAYAVVGSIEAAYSIMANLTVAPQLSALQLRSSMRADCQGGSPSQAFAFLLKAARAGKGVGGLVEEKRAAVAEGGRGQGKGRAAGRRLRGAKGKAERWGMGTSEGMVRSVVEHGHVNPDGASVAAAFPTAAAIAEGGAAAEGARRQLAGGTGSGLCSPVFAVLRKLFGITCKSGVPMDTRKKGFQISGFERTSFYGWFGLLLAVQRQPVVVHIEASAESFKQYDGLSKYQDPACFTYNLNHVVLLVGYRLVGADDTAPHMAPPFWIIRNSWGADWGDGGHMRMDIQGGDGVCGINTLPGLYPVVQSSRDPCSTRFLPFPPSPLFLNPPAPRDPCNMQARRGALGPVLNPCGNFTCRVQGTTNRCDCTDPRFVEALNGDGSRTCAYVDVCRASFRNPCAVGTCVNDGAGSYSCVCPPGFRQGTTVDGTYSCAPGDTDGTYTVLSLGLTCAAIRPVYGLTLPQFTAQNPNVDCSMPLPLNTHLNVTPPDGLTPCSVFYTTDQGDTCASLAAYFQLTKSCNPSGTPCIEALLALNPGLNCTALDSGDGGGGGGGAGVGGGVSGDGLQPNQVVCVERRGERDAAAGGQVIPVCSQYYLVQSAETCESIRNVPSPPLSPLDFFRLNPGMRCSRLVPKTSADSFTGFEGSTSRRARQPALSASSPLSFFARFFSLFPSFRRNPVRHSLILLGALLLLARHLAHRTSPHARKLQAHLSFTRQTSATAAAGTAAGGSATAFSAVGGSNSGSSAGSVNEGELETLGKRGSLGTDGAGNGAGGGVGEARGAGEAEGAGEVRLWNGVMMPRLGFGTAGLGEETERAVGWALEAGYRLFDSAQAREWYREDAVGAAIAQHNVSRNQLFLVSKLHPRHHGHAITRERFSDSLRDLRVPYLDLFLLHYPFCFPAICGDAGAAAATGAGWLDSWRALEELYQRGAVRAIGVSNFGRDELLELIAQAEVKPHVLQRNSDPLRADKDLQLLCAQHGIAYMAYSSLGSQHLIFSDSLSHNPVLDHPVIKAIAARRACSPAQVVLKWGLLKGQVVIPRITKDAEIQESKHLHPIAETGLDQLFQGCTQLEVISFDRLGSALHPNIVFPASFFQLSRLHTLVLPDASTLTNPGLSTLSSLSSIRLTSLNLIFHHLVHLAQLPRLTSLAISYDPEVEEPRGTFSVSQLPFLKSLQLEGEVSPFILFLPSGLPCSRLERLVIAGSHFLDRLPDDLGEILPCLRELTLSWCTGLTSLPGKSLTQLESLKISSCLRFSSLPDNFGRLSALKRLVLRDLPLANLPDSFGRLESLETLTMYMLSLTELPESFAYLTSLKTLLVVCCRKIRQLPVNFGRLGALKTLCMVKLPLLCLPEGLEGMVGIQRIFPDFVFNLLQLPGSLTELTSLTRLDLDLVSDEKLPEGFGKLNQLRQLNIHCCFNLREIPESVTGLTNLDTLTIGMCSELASVPKELEALVKLRRLELTGCHNAIWLNGPPVSLPSSLESLSLGSYNQSIFMPNLHLLPNLKKLILNLVNVESGEADVSEHSAFPQLVHLELVLAEDAEELAFPLASLRQLRILP